MPEKNDFLKRLKEIRKTLGLLKSDFARGLKVSNAFITDLENGKYKPGYDFFIKIVRAYNVNLHYLLFGEGEMFRSPTTHFSKLVDNLSVSRDDVRELLWYFERSPIVQYMILGYFRSILQKEAGAIKKELEEYKAKKKDD
jgi:transcriptional regulator with XRE-family HTH domain